MDRKNRGACSFPGGKHNAAGPSLPAGLWAVHVHSLLTACCSLQHWCRCCSRISSAGLLHCCCRLTADWHPCCLSPPCPHSNPPHAPLPLWSRRDLAAAIWRPELGVAEVVLQRGKLLPHMGIQRGPKQYLFIEEAV